MSVKVTFLGSGAMGSGMAKMVLEKEGIEIAGVYASRSEKHGKDLGEELGLGKSLGIKISNNLDEVIGLEADIIMQATTSFTEEAFPQIEKAVKAGKNVISIAEEMSYPAIGNPSLAEKMHELALENNVTILGTGVNPGFVLDSLIVMLSGACQNVTRIKAARINDLSPFGSTVMRTQGVGTTVEEFHEGIENGNIVGHIGFPESISLVAEALGWELDEITQTREPIISNTHRETAHVKVEPGMVAGCKHIGYGMKDGEAIITLEHPQQIHPG
ncbi:MAG TPA: NAD(P)-binding domain-containing protein, partial [Thermoanaerobacterales bacterium]|nr:NAD(P)-binding domain-containing protein [Thermoanaerobacterales bacterium]